jgi:hypothetical protein
MTRSEVGEAIRIGDELDRRDPVFAGREFVDHPQAAAGEA